MAAGREERFREDLASEIREKAGAVRMLFLDVDGVLTDGGVIYTGDDQESKRFHVRDGAGIKIAQGAGVEIGIITGRASAVVSRRAEELGIERVIQGSLEKRLSLDRLLSDGAYALEEVAYVGDDLLDLPVMGAVGFSACPADAHDFVRGAADYVCRKRGGGGAVREVIDLILEAKGVLKDIERKFLEGGDAECAE